MDHFTPQLYHHRSIHAAFSQMVWSVKSYVGQYNDLEWNLNWFCSALNPISALQSMNAEDSSTLKLPHVLVPSSEAVQQVACPLSSQPHCLLKHQVNSSIRFKSIKSQRGEFWCKHQYHKGRIHIRRQQQSEIKPFSLQLKLNIQCPRATDSFSTIT